MKNDKGEITIRQIIVVIVIIILGAVCIAMLTGENGLFVPKEQNSNNTNTVYTQEPNNQNTVDTNSVNTKE